MGSWGYLIRAIQLDAQRQIWLIASFHRCNAITLMSASGHVAVQQASYIRETTGGSARDVSLGEIPHQIVDARCDEIARAGCRRTGESRRKHCGDGVHAGRID